MSRSSDRRPWIAALTGALAVGLAVAAIRPGRAQAPARYGFGQPATAAQIKGWDIDIRGDDGLGLPPGKGTVKQGETLYLAQCASCHGEFGEGNGRWPELMGGGGTLTSDDPRKTIGSYWPYAPVVFDYVRRTMPFNAPQSLSDDEVYAITAYLLHINDVLPADAELDAARLKAVKLPNRDGFIQGDPRPDVVTMGEPCMSNCRTTPPKVTSDLAQRLGVTPDRKPKD
ncbi:MAG: cytochrome c [Rhodospirillales bacterium]|nr:MAG: cytochrome c [Rhodospirillales bacterium]